MTPDIIEKEQISQLNPVDYEVLGAEEMKQNRMRLLLRFLRAGNIYKAKAWIYFHTMQGIKAVNTTIWSVTDSHVALKGGVMIPIHAISEVKS